MTEPTNADRAAQAAQALEAFAAAEGPARLSAADAMAELVTGLVHYADRHGINFGQVLAASSDAYTLQRRAEEHPYSVGQEVRLRDAAVLSPSLATLPTRGVVAALYPGGHGPQAYAIRFPGEVNAMPFTGSEIEPAPPFQPVRTRQGIVRSLAEAEDVLISTAARIRVYQLRKARPAGPDTGDLRLLATALGETCDLAPEDMLRQVEIRVTARVQEDLASLAASDLGREHARTGIAPFERERETTERLTGALRERGLTIPSDPAFQRVMLFEYHSAFDYASGKLPRNRLNGTTPAVSTPQLADRDFPRHFGESLAALPRATDPAAGRSPAQHARRHSPSRTTGAPVRRGIAE